MTAAQKARSSEEWAEERARRLDAEEVARAVRKAADRARRAAGARRG